MTLQELLQSADIVEYIRNFVGLEHKSDGDYWGISPFKEENTPSFSVSSEGVWKDFSSGKGGNILTFIQEYNKCNFYKAVDILKKYLNINDDIVSVELDAIKYARKFKQKEKKQKNIDRKELSSYAIERYKKCDIIEWINEGISQSVMDKYGVRYDVNNNAIIFEVRDDSGVLVSFKCRNLDESKRKLGLPKYTYTNKIGCNDFLFGLYKNKNSCIEKKEIILVEGEKSVFKLETWGIDNCCAVCTSHLNEQQLKTLKLLGINVVIAFDKDQNKVIAGNKELIELRRFCKVYLVRDFWNMLDEKDAPVDKGFDTWKYLYERKMIM